MKRITDPTPDEIQRAIFATYCAIHYARMLTPDWDNNASNLAVHVLAQMQRQGRLTVVLAYEEARTFVTNGSLTLAGPVMPGLDAMLGALLTLHFQLAILNHGSARALDDPKFASKHWGVTEDLTPELDYTERTPMHFCIDPVQAEINLDALRATLSERMAKVGANLFDMTATARVSDRIAHLIQQ